MIRRITDNGYGWAVNAIITLLIWGFFLGVWYMGHKQNTRDIKHNGMEIYHVETYLEKATKGQFTAGAPADPPERDAPR